MALFDDYLQDSESLFKDEIALDHDYIPKKIPFRENENQQIAEVIKPLLKKRNTANLFITGNPGVGKTLAVKHVFREMEEKGLTDDVYTFYVNCWQKDSAHKIVLEICNQLNYRFAISKTTDQLLSEITKRINQKAMVLALDEIDKLDKEALSVIYTLLETTFKRSIILITNVKTFLPEMDERILSRLLPQSLEFKPYTEQETYQILKERVEFAFVQKTFEEEALKKIAKKTYELEDIRTGLFLLREAGNHAERKLKRKIEEEDANQALEKLSEYKSKNNLEFNEEESKLLELIKTNSGKSTKELFNLLKEPISYKTFSRRLETLKRSNIIRTEEINEGESKKTIVYFGSIKK